MIWGVVFGVATVAFVVLLAGRYYLPRPRHTAGAGGASVGRLVARVETETRGGGRHQLRGMVTIRGDLADDLAEVETRILPLPAEIQTAHPDDPGRRRLTLHRLLAGMRRM
ncbi:hypothetical protein MOQ72_29230 [Saccharopolyspora sp. K220]|uniref:hypothetical protein n=1 Tax=Saccharopolyspora soli TaxID=2926618 RepID=UPI001F571EFE|nr:hypothetical protein [Saccharopolyspora soli]MCI2421525.1 hypothetical protein [Saccharopolyspora soli]